MTMTSERSEAPVYTNMRGRGLLMFTLWFGMLDLLFFGVLQLAFPEYLVETLSEQAEFSYFAMRWAGGLMIALTLGIVYLMRAPKGQMPMFTTFATASALSGIGFLWSWLADEWTGNTWFLVAMLIGSLGLSLLMWITRVVARDLLE